ncbi:MAG: amidohydrolase family protein [Planctomycetota bacterium]
MIVAGYLLEPPHPPMPGWLAIDQGRIVDRGEGLPASIDFGGPDHLITPGFVDAHLHIPQSDSTGYDGLELLPWLEQVIYPAETAWHDLGIASRQIDAVHRELLTAGTVAYAGYLTSHGTGLHAMAESKTPRPRAIVGQVRMDRNGHPALIDQHPLPIPADTADVRWSLNPRFAIACSDDSMAATASAMTDSTFIQTHLSESVTECDEIARLFPDDPHYTAVYDRHGLLTPRTLLAHGLHLVPEEWSLIAERDAVVVHCPTANTFLSAGVFDLRSAMKHGVRLALGSDVAAGPEFDMPRIARGMIEVAKIRRLTIDPDAIVPTPADAWTMITRTNATALGHEDLGHLHIGGTARMLLLRPTFSLDEHVYSQLIYRWSRRFIDCMLLDGEPYTFDSSSR